MAKKVSLCYYFLVLLSSRSVHLLPPPPPPRGERGGSVVECRTPEREVRGSRPTAAVLCPWARHFTPRKYWLITQEAMAPSRHDWKIVDWDVKPQHKPPPPPPSPPDLTHNKSLLRSWIKWDSFRFSESVSKRRRKQYISSWKWKVSYGYPIENFEIPMKHYSDILWYPIENVIPNSPKKVVRTYPVPSNPYMELYCFSSGRLPFFRAIRIEGWTKLRWHEVLWAKHIIFH